MNTQQKLLIIDSNERFARMLVLELSDFGFKVEHLSLDKLSGQVLNFTLNDIIDRVIAEEYSLILINISSSYAPAVEFYTKLGHRTFVPCIFIHKKESDLEILSAAGFIPSSLEMCRRPFDPEDLYRQIRSVLVSNTTEDGSKKHKLIILGHLSINEAAHIVTYGSETVELTKKEFELLRFLTLRHGNALSREEIFVKVWGFNYYGDTNVVDVYIRYLRAKLDQHFNVKIIHTIRGVGYMIV